MNETRVFAVAMALLAWSLPAQQFVHVPAAAAASTDASSMFAVAGVDRDAREQIIIDASHLVGMIGREVVALAFRRDRGWHHALDGGQSTLTVLISPAPFAPTHASPQFDMNLDPTPSNRIVVHSGVIAVPASSDASARPVSWDDPQDVVEIRFSTRYPYYGGHLCVDLTGSPVTGSESSFWAVDGEIDSARGSVAAVGVPCGGAAPNQPYPEANVAGYELIAGSTARFRGYGRGGASGAYFLGVPMGPFDLSWIGVSAPGCELHVSPFAVFPVAFEPLAVNDPLGCARVSIQIPSDQSSLGFAFRVQYLSVTALVETTNALDCVVASAAPTLGMATVYAPIGAGPTPSVGDVRANRAPVLRFEFE